MTDEVNGLSQRLGLGSGAKPKAEHHISGRMFPFFTRNPERVKFKSNFNEIIGIIVRISLGKVAILGDTSETQLANILDQVVVDGAITNAELANLFAVDFDTMLHPFLFQYFPVEMETTAQKSEAKGKAVLGYYITKLLKLDENAEWQAYFTQQQDTDLYESVYTISLADIEPEPVPKTRLQFFDQDKLVTMFNHDLHQLMQSEKAFLNDIGLLISYYFFYYVLEQTFLLTKPDRQPHALWFAFDKERVSGGRACVQKGYKVFNEASRELLLNNDLIDYLNVLAAKDTYQSYAGMMADQANYPVLGQNLMLFNSQFAASIQQDYQPTQSIEFQIRQLQRYLRSNISPETASRYRKSFDEFSGLGFIKSRGRLGYVLNATQEFILMLVGIVIGDQEKILLNKLFEGFEARGVYFDNQSKREITAFFEEVNILEKLSDSGDAQYVKSIL